LWRRKVCYVSDSPPPLIKSAEEAFIQVLSFCSRSEAPTNSASQLEYFREVAEQLGLSASALQRPFTVLSAGERQRVSLSWAIALHPQILLLDEPTSHLDSEARARFESLIRLVGCTIVCASSLAHTHHPTTSRMGWRGMVHCIIVVSVIVSISEQYLSCSGTTVCACNHVRSVVRMPRGICAVP
jgi:ABC-type molybdenum transport system ATPase subunit/photorepair protein PhrA